MTKILAGRHVLVVEDEYYIASDLKRALTQEEAVIVGPANAVEPGLAMVRDRTIDVAILDVGLDRTTSFAIADALMQRAVPFMFLTGYDGATLPDAYRAVPCVAKPFDMAAVMGTLQDLVAVGISA